MSRTACTITILLCLLWPRIGLAMEQDVLSVTRQVELKHDGQVIINQDYRVSILADTLPWQLTVTLPGTNDQSGDQLLAAHGQYICDGKSIAAGFDHHQLIFSGRCPEAEVHYRFTVARDPEGFSDLFADTFRSPSYVRAQEYHYTLTLPVAASVRWQLDQATLLDGPGQEQPSQSFTWSMRPVPGSNKPLTFQVSQVEDWEQIRTRYNELWSAQCRGFHAPQPLDLGIRAESDLDRTKALLELLHTGFAFQQTPVAGHYLTPTLCATTLADRTGDCKDLSLLMASILNQWGIPAEPALRRASWARTSLPDPYVFNHALVVVHLGAVQMLADSSSGALRPLQAGDADRLLVLAGLKPAQAVLENS